ncbi:helix-turn-helix domain-containing protein [Streptomyces sp. NPDC091416]|uniref:helix-turn-helix domain-containing protein n=1 Tax=Streptomyces sp. NPDC091416 TaxID=3366003 RepID=UPI00382C96BF
MAGRGVADFAPASLLSERTGVDLSREELARSASRYEPCLSAAHVGLYELGLRVPQLSTLAALARALGVEVRALLVPVEIEDLARLRVEAGVRQRDLARSLGLAQARWSRIERGLLAPEPDFLRTVAETLGRPVEVVARSALHTRRPASAALARHKRRGPRAGREMTMPGRRLAAYAP